jgi:hypothetical protein
MKKVILLLSSVLIAGSSFAQLSSRTNDATIEKIGARPQAGDMALTFGLNLSSLLGSNSDSTVAELKVENTLMPGNLLTFRYYKTNDVVYRAGIRLYKDSKKYKGSSDSTVQSSAPYVTDREVKNSQREYDIVPGIEKHFSASNIFDVYVGGDLYLGWKRDISIDNTTYKDGAQSDTKRTTSSGIVGLGGVVGFNVFVAHLPISLGLEYGWAAKWVLGGKTKVVTDQNAGGGATTTSLTYYTTSQDPNEVAFTSLKQSEFQMETNSNVRIVANIYFGRGSKQ